MTKKFIRRSIMKQVLVGTSVSCALVVAATNTPSVFGQEEDYAVESSTVSMDDSINNNIENTESEESDELVPSEEKAVTSEEKGVLTERGSSISDETSQREDNIDQAADSVTEIKVVDSNEQDALENESAKVDITLPLSTVYMTENTTIEDASLHSTTISEKLIWTYDGKSINDVKTWNLTAGAGGGFTGDDFIKVTENVTSEGIKYQFHVNSLFGSDLSERTRYGNIRREYRKHIGEHILRGVSEDGSITVTKIINLRPYKNFHTYEETLAEIEMTKNNALNDRQVTIETIGKSAQGRDIKMGIIAKNQQAIDDYLNKTTPLMLSKPDELLTLLEKGQLDYKLPVLFNNTHADEQPGIDIVTGLFKDFATKENITFRTTENNQEKNVVLNVKSLLEKLILLFNFTENPDGDVNNSRQLANGLDPNRDTGYQTNPETRAIVEQINKWNPISVLDFHGFVKGFLIEPATPPHDPNFEYDLISSHLLEGAHQMGRAGVTNSKYNSYVIPKLDYGSGWDDAFSGYTAVYALYHGILGHTIEIPESNQESYLAGFYAGLAGANYVLNNTDDLMKMRLAFYSRGVNKIESKSAENELVGPDGEIIGRNKGNNPQFFPDYYVLPMRIAKDNPTDQAFEMIEYFKRNGVIIKELIEDFGGYKKGDLVIDMAQAKRGFANHVLYMGSDESKWPAMYAELVVNFPIMRGFKAFPIFNHGLFTDKLGDVTYQSAPRTQMNEKAPYYVVANNSVATIRAINEALKNGKNIYRTIDGYIMDRETFSIALQNHALYGEPVYKKPVGETIKRMKIYSPYHTYNWTGDLKMWSDAQNALEQVGFDIVQSYDEADVLVLDGDEFDASWLGKKPTIIVGGVAMQHLENLGVLPGFDAEHFQYGEDFEGLMKAIVDKSNLLSSGYAENDFVYSNSGNWIERIPEGFKSVIKIASQNFYLAGWWPNHQAIANKVMALDGMYQNQNMFIYAGNPMNKTHTLNFYRWIANAIYRGQIADLVDISDSDEYVPSVPQLEPKVEEQQLKKPKPKVGEQQFKESELEELKNPELPNQKYDEEKLNISNVAISNVVQQAKVLPSTGESKNMTFVIGAFFIILGANVLYFRREEII